MNTPTRRLLTSLLACLAATSALVAQQTCPLLAIVPTTTTSSTLWDVNPTTGATSNPRTVSTAPNRSPISIDFAPNGTLYGISHGSAGTPPGGMLFTINPATGAAAFVANLTQFVGVEGDIACDPTTGILYAVDGQGLLFTINTANGVCTVIGSLPMDLPGGADYSGLGFDEFGQLHVWSQFGSVLRRVNKANAAVQSTVPLSPFPGGGVGDVVFDRGSGRCFLAGDMPGGFLSSVDPNTGAVTPIGATNPMGPAYGMTSNPNACARVHTVGTGCTSGFASFYEHLFGWHQDLAGMMVVGTFNGSGYTITTVPGPGVIFPIGLAPLSLGDNTSVSVGTLGMWVGSNGWLALGPGNSTAPIPSVPTMLNQPAPQLSAWTDLDPSTTGGGQVYYWEPAAGVGQATWFNVFAKGTTLPVTIQITWDLGSRNWTIEFGSYSPWHPHPWLTGYSPGGVSADPGNSDISTFGSNPHTIDLFDTLPLVLTAANRPVQTAVATPYPVVTSNIDPNAILHLGWVGLVNPALPLSIFGLPNDCILHASIDVTSASNWFPGPVQPWNAFVIPALPPALLGVQVNCQAGTFTSSGIGPTTRVSNGLLCTLGTL